MLLGSLFGVKEFKLSNKPGVNSLSVVIICEMNYRNYQARNMMRDEMKMNDLVLFYHSNTKPHPHIAGIAKVSGAYMTVSSIN